MQELFSKERRENLFNNLFQAKGLDEIRIFSFNANKRLLSFLGQFKEETDVKVYLDDNSENKDILDLECLYDNIEINFIQGQHIKSIGYFSKSIDARGAFFGSANFSEQGISENEETLLNFPYKKHFKDKKYSSSSLLQGLHDKIKKETGFPLINKKVSKKPVDFYNAKEYYKELKKISNKLPFDSKVFVVSPKLSLDLVKEMFEDIENLNILYSQDTSSNYSKTTKTKSNMKLHSKMIYIETDKNYYVGLGSSNFTPSGLGVVDKYTKKECNLLISLSKYDYEDINQFLDDPICYVNNKYSKKTVKTQRDINVLNKKYNTINKLFAEHDKIIDDYENGKIEDYIAVNDVIIKLKDIYDIVRYDKKSKEDVLNKVTILEGVKNKVYSLFKT